jgi:hypothetical protein
MTRIDNRFEDIDKAALHNALLALHTCPHCRDDLQPVNFLFDVYGCAKCKETWYIEAACLAVKTMNLADS